MHSTTSRPALSSRLPITDRLSSTLNATRWIAATLVMLSHVRKLLFASADTLPHIALPYKLFYFLTALGDEAVMIFFVISGFLVGGISLAKADAGRLSLRSYGLDRLSRIYVVLLPALVIGGCLDAIGIAFFNASGLYSGTTGLPIAMVIKATGHLGPDTLAGNLAMLQGNYVPAYGSNGPLWTLACEWWYYVAFAGAVAASRARMPARAIGIAALLLAVAALWGHGMILAIVWVMGIAASLYVRSSLPKPPIGVGLVVLIAGLLVAVRMHGAAATDTGFSWPQLAGRLAMGAAFTVFIVSAARGDRALPFAEMHARLADFSYSLYLVHTPVIVFAIAMLHDKSGLPLFAAPSLGQFIIAIAISIAAFAFAFLFSLATEKQTARVRKALQA